MKINFNGAFAIIKRKNELNAHIFEGKLRKLNTLDELGEISKKENLNKKYITISVLPFSQIKERNFLTRDEGCKILCIEIEKHKLIPVNKLVDSLPCEKIEVEKDLTYEYSDEDYEKIIKSVIENEIGNGEGANFVIPRKATGKIKDMSVKKVLSIYRNILINEPESYWNFVFYDGERFLIGASPEAHICVKNNRVKMHPISGTFRKEYSKINLPEVREKFLKFLSDKKEINELFMVVDEELKVMAKICTQGGMIIGPLLKEMSTVIHTEYLLSGKTDKDIVEILRNSMFAATVTGSPIESACRVIHKYEKEDRRYYASAIVLIGRDKDKKIFLDSAILIRTIEIDKDGNFLTRSGSTIVRDSIPSEEVAETKYKIKGIINSIKYRSKKSPLKILPYFEEDDEVLELLQERNQKLSKFWFFNQEGADYIVDEIKNKRITIIDNEDDFCYMLKHMLSHLGAIVTIVRYNKYIFEEDKSDITIIGPGPGNPNNTKNEKMKVIEEITKKLIESKKKFIGICLGHQFICKCLGIKIVRKKEPFQGVQKVIDFFGRKEIVGFYNTFTGKYEKEIEGQLKSKNIEICFDRENNEIYAIKGKNFVGFQFHPESILTQNGLEILRKNLIEVIKR